MDELATSCSRGVPILQWALCIFNHAKNIIYALMRLSQTWGLAVTTFLVSSQPNPERPQMWVTSLYSFLSLEFFLEFFIIKLVKKAKTYSIPMILTAASSLFAATCSQLCPRECSLSCRPGICMPVAIAGLPSIISLLDKTLKKNCITVGCPDSPGTPGRHDTVGTDK